MLVVWTAWTLWIVEYSHRNIHLGSWHRLLGGSRQDISWERKFEQEFKNAEVHILMMQPASFLVCTNMISFCTACRLAYGLDMLCIVCELVVAVCTLVYLFNLQQTVDGENGGSLEHRSREMTLGFMSLGFTLATLVVMAIGADKLAQSGRTVWARLRENLGTAVSRGGATAVHADVNNTLGGVHRDAEELGHEGQATQGW